MSELGDLREAAKGCFTCTDPRRKCELTAQTFAALRDGKLVAPVSGAPAIVIETPGRPERPNRVPPRDVPQRGLGSVEGRAALVHAVAHIEFNAINLAWDAVLRFAGMPEDYYQDWAGVAADEARHFGMLAQRLEELGHVYGDFDAHNGLWEMAEKTAHDGLARMALVPRVLEARGLDVTPAMIVKLRALGDEATATILETILREEVAHVAAGSRWFRWYCAREGADPCSRFRELLDDYARGSLRGPFNRQARLAAGFDTEEISRRERRG